MIVNIARREMQSLFRTPFAWWVLAAVQFLLAYQFLAQIDLFLEYLPKIRRMSQPPGVTQLVVVPTFNLMSFLLLFLIPVLTMQSFAGERRQGTMKLWYSAPVNLTQLVLGKFLGVLSVFAAVLGLVALMPLTLLWGTTLDLGTYASGVLALLLLTAAGSALGLAFSALSAQPAVAAVSTLVSLLGLWLIDWASQLERDASVLAELSMLRHFQALSRGLIDTSDVGYFVVFTAAALALTGWALRGDRYA